MRGTWIGSLCWIIVGCVFCAGAWKYKLRTAAGMPGAGFFPFLMGISLVILSLIDFASTIYYRKRETKEPLRDGLAPRHQDRWIKISIALAVLFAYGIALEHLGFLITSFLFIFFLLRFVDPQRWSVSVGIAIAATAISYAIFDVWLQVRMPKGVLGI